MQVFEEHAHLQFAMRMSAHFATIYPADEHRRWGHASEAELQQRVIKGAQKAEAYGFITETAQFDYLVCQMELGDDFDINARLPWASAILNDGGGTGRNLRLSASLQLQLLLQFQS